MKLNQTALAALAATAFQVSGVAAAQAEHIHVTEPERQAICKSIEKHLKGQPVSDCEEQLFGIVSKVPGSATNILFYSKANKSGGIDRTCFITVYPTAVPLQAIEVEECTAYPSQPSDDE